MATRLYLTAQAPGTFLRGPLQGGWVAGDSSRSVRGDGHFTFIASATKANGGVNDATAFLTFNTSTTKANNQAIASNLRWVSEPLSAGATISGTLDITLRVSRIGSNPGASGVGRCFAYISDGDTLDVKLVLINNVSHATAWDINQTWRTMQFAVTSRAAAAGDRLVIEFGSFSSPGTGEDNGFKLAYGTTDGSNVALADAVDLDTGQKAAWCEWSTNVTFVAGPSVPANDACADATLISELPYSSARADVRASADTNRAVWWTWVADRSGPIGCSVFGSNYDPRIQVSTGACGSLVQVILNQEQVWLGLAQTAAVFEATEGTTYTFRVDAQPNGGGGTQAYESPINSAGSLIFNVWAFEEDLEDDDMFVDCQHIACYRNGQAIKINTGTFGNTPTGNAIDYTLRPIEDANGGTSTSLRLYAAYFGFDGFIVILDLATLNWDGTAIDTISDPIAFYADQSQNLSSVIFNQSGVLLLGWYGDNYSVIDIEATPPTAALRMVDGTHGDDQTAAPWPLSDEFDPDYQDGGTDFAELSSDQDTVWYTSGGDAIKRYSLADGQLADFTTLPAATGPRPGARSVRLLPPGDGSAGLLVAYGDKVYRVDSNGTVVQTYTPTQTTQAQDLDKIEITADYSSFWVSDQYSCNLFKFQINSGAQTDRIETFLAPGQLSGFCLYNGFRGGDSPTPPDGGNNGPPGLEALEQAGVLKVIPTVRQRRTPHTSDLMQRFFVSYYQLDIQPGVGIPDGQGEDPKVEIRWSNDGGFTWGNGRTMTLGRQGNYQHRAITWQCGMARDRVIEVTMSDPVPAVWADLYVGVDESTQTP